MTLYDLLNKGSAALQQAGDTDGENDAKLLLFEALHLDLVHFLMDRLRPLSEQDAKVQEQIRTYREMIEKRASRIPLQQILGSQEFMGLTFRVTPDVLIPRQDTETLVEQVLQEQKDPDIRLLDLCTGSGCVIVSILHNVSDVEGYAVDISKQALNVAKENARLNDVPVLFEHSDLFDHVTGTFDVIVSNPPYICTDEIAKLMPEVRDFEPMEALDGKEDGLYFYRKIIGQCKQYLNPEGHLLFEIGYDQGQKVSALMREIGFHDVQVIKDLARKDRVVTGML